MAILIGITILFAVIFTLCIVKFKSLSTAIKKDFILNPHIEPAYDEFIDVRLVSFSGFGTCFQGSFRKAKIDGYETYVTYYCSIYLFVIVPKVAYRVILTSGPWDPEPSWDIIGYESEDPREISCIRYKFAAIWTGGITLCCVFVSLMFGFLC